MKKKLIFVKKKKKSRKIELNIWHKKMSKYFVGVLFSNSEIARHRGSVMLKMINKRPLQILS